MKYLFNALIISVLLFSCGDEPSERQTKNKNVVSSPLELEINRENYNIAFGDSVVISGSTNDDSKVLTDIHLLMGEEVLSTFEALPFEFTFHTGDHSLGRKNFKLVAKENDKLLGRSMSFTIVSDKEPVRLKHTVVNIFEHDTEAYTQGLFYHDGYLYEGTGQKGLSSLRKVDLNTGKVLKKLPLDDKIFGEGISYFGDRIYQLSWVAQVGYVYDLEFNELNRFYYDGEGWGLTSDSVHLIRTEGTNKIYFHDPNTMNVVKVLEVFAKDKSVGNLNELEWIKGKIYANVWRTDDIVIIDPKSGMVEAKLNLSKILKLKFRDSNTEVMNGIAYDPVNDRIFVTGKYWSKLFEIQIQDLPS